MTLIIIFLILIAIFSNVMMDELDFHYSRLIGKLISSKGESWWNPALSWHNKYIEGSKILTYIFSTVLVWTTDAWHFFKTLFLFSIILILLFVENKELIWWQYGIEFLVCWFLWGLIFESVLGIFGAISDKLNK
jgi:hypothetical protein